MKTPSATAIVGGEELWIQMRMNGDYSLYFHVPFCTRKCDYCHFYVIPDKENLKNQYMQGLEKEWKFQTLNLPPNGRLVSIYFGGGTPALIGPENIRKILNWIKPHKDVEITLEANPENIHYPLMKAYANCGVNRVSIGIQSLDDDQLKILGRTHHSKKAIEAVWMTQEAGISNISVDLMYDLPNQTLLSWKLTLEQILKLPITHLSLYNLTIEPHTLFFKKKEQLISQLPSGELSLQFLKEALDQLTANNFNRYELSAFCKDNKISNHNIGYWRGRPFLGLGPSAFSYWEGKRFRNVANLSKYCKNLEEGNFPIDFTEELSGDEKLREHLVIGLRILKGVDLKDFSNQWGSLSKTTTSILEKLINEGYLVKKDTLICLSEKGQLFYDSVAEELI